MCLFMRRFSHFSVTINQTCALTIQGMVRWRCKNRSTLQVLILSISQNFLLKRIFLLKFLQKYEEMKATTPMRERLEGLRNLFNFDNVLKEQPIQAYIVTSYDEHQNQHLDVSDKRIKFISGFTGKNANAVVS